MPVCRCVLHPSTQKEQEDARVDFTSLIGEVTDQDLIEDLRKMYTILEPAYAAMKVFDHTHFSPSQSLLLCVLVFELYEAMDNLVAPRIPQELRFAPRWARRVQQYISDAEIFAAKVCPLYVGLSGKYLVLFHSPLQLSHWCSPHSYSHFFLSLCSLGKRLETIYRMLGGGAVPEMCVIALIEAARASIKP